MMIWKYELQRLDVQNVLMQDGARPLCAQMQNGSICVWAIVDPNALLCPYKFLIVGTGYAPPDFGDFTYLPTVQEGPFVWHIFHNCQEPTA